jgi:hypothetical protein
VGDLTAQKVVNPDGDFRIMIGSLLAPTNSVPAVAARQRGQVLFCMNGRKGCVGW